MVTFKVVFGTKQGKCVQKDIADPAASELLGKNVGEKISGDTIGFPGYEFQITGGSDFCGFPMRADIPGPGRKRILDVRSTGIKSVKGKGVRQRKTVCGAMVHPKTMQINMKVLKEGSTPLIDMKAEEAKDAAKAEAKAAAKTAVKAAA